MKSRFETVIRKFKEGFSAGAAPKPAQDLERFTMKPGEVTIHRGGGVRIQRRPGDPRGD